MGIFDDISSFFNPQDAYKSAMGPVQQGYNNAIGYETPFMQNGMAQYGNLNTAENALLNPAQLESQWASGYTASPYAQRMLQMNQQSGLDAASSMGLMGSSGALSNIQQGAGDIVNQDRQQYLNDLMQKYMSGVGIGQNLYGIGAGMAGNMGQQAMEEGNTMAGLQYGEQAAPGALFGSLLGSATSAAANAAMPGVSSMFRTPNYGNNTNLYGASNQYNS